MNEISLSEIQITPLKARNGLLGFSSFVINNCLYVGDVGIYSSPTSTDGFRLTYPTRVLKNGKSIQILHPINKNTGEQIKKAVVKEYLRLMSQFR